MVGMEPWIEMPRFMRTRWEQNYALTPIDLHVEVMGAVVVDLCVHSLATDPHMIGPVAVDSVCMRRVFPSIEILHRSDAIHYILVFVPVF